MSTPANGLNVTSDGLVYFDGTSDFSTQPFTALTAYVPVLTFGGSSTGITYSIQGGSYARVGPMIFFTAGITLTNKGSATGNAAVSLPVADKVVTGNSQLYTVSAQNITFTTQLVGQSSGGTQVLLRYIQSGTSVTAITHSDFANNSVIVVHGCYFAA